MSPRPSVRLIAALALAAALAAPCRVALAQSAAPSACPGETAARDAGTLLVAHVAGVGTRPLSRADLEAIEPRTVTQRRSLEREGVREERSLQYGGWLLRDVLARAGFDDRGRRDTRTWIVEAIATDGYRAVFSWGELYNSAAGEQVYVIASQDGQPLDAAAGPLALRALADQRPGPRHVRNLCAVSVHPASP